MPSDDSWTHHATADLARLRQAGRNRPGSIRLGQAERYVDRLASPNGDLEPKWRDYLRRFVNAFRGRPAQISPEPETGAGAGASTSDPPSWTEQARQFAPHMLRVARQLDELDAALVANPRNDVFRRLFYGGRLEQTKSFHEEATTALQKAVAAGEERVAQHDFDQRVRTAPAPAQPTLPNLVAQAAQADVERQRAGLPNGQQPAQPLARPGLTRAASTPTPKKAARL
ncbi:hypothetical protein AB0368_05010 [Actinoplanes sp. NPDC051475]|uniref:hypothetical protein n=1 Tax=Actinoplanes sp. NPDC051475 TaxID=3157225 RepID=UPI00344B3681